MSNRCIICHNENTEFWGQKGKYTGVQCTNCGLVWVDPLPTYQELEEFYNGYLNNRLNNDVLWEQRQQMYILERDFLEQFISVGNVLDLGCGDGGFLNIFSDKWHKFGVEIEDEAVQQGLKKNINVIKGSPEESIEHDVLFDCVIMRGVIEHFIHPEKVIENVSKSLREKGYFYITSTPDVDSFSADLYRGKWNQFEPPAHLFYFSVKTLTRLVEKFGFKKIIEHHFYTQTPYANVTEDHKRILDDIQLLNNERQEEVEKSPAFWGNMMTVLYVRD